MIAFWGEPGANEPGLDTPLTFLGIDDRWRKLAARDLGNRKGYLSHGNTLSPDGSRWVAVTSKSSTMLNFETGEMTDLKSVQGTSHGWSPDSQSLAVWSIRRPGIDVYERSGRHVAQLDINAEKRRVIVPDSKHITVFENPNVGESPTVEFTTYDLTGSAVATTTCALPDGYPPARTGVDGYDGSRLQLAALVDKRRHIYRRTTLDASTGETIQDIESVGFDPYLDQQVAPGIHMSGLSAASDGIYAADPTTGQTVRLGRIGVYEDQEGYENHASSQFAHDLIFDE